MARPSKLTHSQVEEFRTLRKDPKKRYTMAQLCKKFGISESSGYKVMDGTYIARPDAPKPLFTTKAPTGRTPSIFHPERTEPALLRLVGQDPIMELAEQLVAAKAALVHAVRAA